jgi:hypothetical protein
MPTFSINTQETDSKQTGLIYDDGVAQIQLRLSKADIDRWNIPIDHLKFGSILGKGAFGIVMYGEFDQTLKDETKRPVAIKKLKGENLLVSVCSIVCVHRDLGFSFFFFKRKRKQTQSGRFVRRVAYNAPSGPTQEYRQSCWIFI